MLIDGAIAFLEKDGTFIVIPHIKKVSLVRAGFKPEPPPYGNPGDKQTFDFSVKLLGDNEEEQTEFVYESKEEAERSRKDLADAINAFWPKAQETQTGVSRNNKN